MKFDTKRQRAIPDMARSGAGTTVAGTQGTDYRVIGQLGAGVFQFILAFDTVYTRMGGTARDPNVSYQLVPDAIPVASNVFNIVASADNSPCQVSVSILDQEPNPLTFGQLLSLSRQDVDRPPVAVAADTGSYKCFQYVCLARFCTISIKNTGAVNTNWYLSVTASG